MNRQLIEVFGPTGVGKSALALKLALQFEGEIVSADSRQVYRQMDIGTDKPSAEDQALVPHYLIDLVEPDEEFTLAQYQRLAFEVIEDIQDRGRLPFFVGGTSLYLRAVLEGWKIPEVAPNPDIRRALEARAESNGPDELYAELEKVDPSAAAGMLKSNTRRIIRALEVYYSTGRPISELQGKEPPPYQVLKIGLTMERKRLYEKIDHRVDLMMERGLVEEVRGLLEKGYGLNLPSMSGLGYREIGQYLCRQMTLDEAIQKIKFNTHKFVRHQYVWFRRELDANWIDMSQPNARKVAEELIERFLCSQVP